MGRQEAQWRRLTVRGVISPVSEKLLTHIITPSPLERKKKKKRSPICAHTHNSHGNVQGEGRQIERFDKDVLELGVGWDFPKCSHSLF